MNGITTPKKIIFYHYSFAIPAEVWWTPEKQPTEIRLKQAAALDLPKELTLVVKERRIVHFPDIFHQHMDTLRSIVEAVRNLGVSIFVKFHKPNGG
jgi:hypothetical protein